MVAVCVDAGTSLVKAVAFDDDGIELAVARRPTTIRHPRPGWSEQDMWAVWAATAAAIAELTAACGPVDRLAVTGQGDGCWLVDAAGEPTGPAVLWNDCRAAALVGQWQDDGRLEAGFRLNGSLGFAGLPHAILAWMREHDPDRIRRSAAALTCTSWLFSRLTGEVGLDPSEACNPFFAAGTLGYDERVLDLFGITELRRLLPPVRQDDQRAAVVLPAVAEQLGVPPGIPVVMAPFDIPATTLGLGVMNRGQVACIMGTTLSTSTFTDAWALSEVAAAGMTLHGVPPRDYLRVLASLAGTEVLDWWTTLLGLNHASELVGLAAGSATDAARLPRLLPYLSPAGERAPFLNPAARASLHNFTLEHTRADIARAVLVGLTLVIRDCVTALTESSSPSELRVAGGGAHSDDWCQLLADCCAAPVIRPAGREVGAKGALIVSAVATGVFESIGDAVTKLVHPGSTFWPRPEVSPGLPSQHDFVEFRQAVEVVWPTS